MAVRVEVAACLQHAFCRGPPQTRRGRTGAPSNETEVSLPLGARRGKSPCHRTTCSLILTADSGGRAVAALSRVAEDLPEIARHRRLGTRDTWPTTHGKEGKGHMGRTVELDEPVRGGCVRPDRQCASMADGALTRQLSWRRGRRGRLVLGGRSSEFVVPPFDRHTTLRRCSTSGAEGRRGPRTLDRAGPSRGAQSDRAPAAGYLQVDNTRSRRPRPCRHRELPTCHGRVIYRFASTSGHDGWRPHQDRAPGLGR